MRSRLRRRVSPVDASRQAYRHTAMATISRRGLLETSSALALLHSQPAVGNLLAGLSRTRTPLQSISSVSPAEIEFPDNAGSAGARIATMTAGVSPPQPGFSGAWSLTGPDA